MPILLAGLLVLGLTPRAAALGAEADQMILDGLDALYGLDFALAENRFRAADQLEPASPAAPFFLSGLYWLQYSQNADLPGNGKELETLFNQELDRALARAGARLKKDPKDVEANFYFGASYGMKGRWQILKHRWIRAAVNGAKGYKYLKKAVQLDPDFSDAYLGLGMYDYYAATLPAALKLATIVVEKGDKKRGMEYVEMTMAKGHYSRTEAKLFLIGVYSNYEHKPELAVDLAKELRKEKPDNVFYALLEVMTRIDSKDWEGAIAVAETLDALVAKTPYAAPQSSLFDLYLGQAYLGHQDWDKALAAFDRCILRAPDLRKGAVTYCRLRLAQTYDLMGRRKEALQNYRDARKQPEIWDSVDKAKKGLKKPATFELVVSQLVD